MMCEYLVHLTSVGISAESREVEERGRREGDREEEVEGGEREA